LHDSPQTVEVLATHRKLSALLLVQRFDEQMQSRLHFRR
jgi:hypothetical protein